VLVIALVKSMVHTVVRVRCAYRLICQRLQATYIALEVGSHRLAAWEGSYEVAPA
jgi:hypothetical protein